MIKKILLVALWTVVLPFCASIIVMLVCVAYLKVTLHGARPSEQTHETVVNLWTFTSQVAQPLVLLLGVFGWLPGTRLRTNAPSPSRWAKWCYYVGVTALFLASVISIFGHGHLWDILAIALLVFLLGVALIDKYAGHTKTAATPSL